MSPYREHVESLPTEEIQRLLHGAPGDEAHVHEVGCQCDLCCTERDVLMDRGLGPRW